MIDAADITQAYADYIRDHIDSGWDPTLLTFMFEQLRRSTQSVARQMEFGVERVYALLVTRMVRKPRSLDQQGSLPIWLGCPDWPVPKHDRQSLQDVTVNDGQHIHIIALTPPSTRLKGSFHDHIVAEEHRYRQPPIRRIHSQPITYDVDRVVDYMLKSLDRGRVSTDGIILLPRSVRELPSRN